MTETTLKSCPFCGSEAAMIKGDPVKLSWISIRCMNCCVETPMRSNVDKAESIWNRRVANVRE